MNLAGLKKLLSCTLGSGLLASALLAQDVPLANWTVPPYHAASASEGLRTMTDVTEGVVFVGVSPCRLVDTRQAGFPAGYGTPSLAAGVPRNFDLNSDSLCPGIPISVSAYSLNITVTNTLGPGFILIYPQGGVQPSVSTVNYVAGQTIANAAIVPAGTAGGVTVIAGVSGTHLIIDINGYFASSLNSGNQVVLLADNSSYGTLLVGNTNTGASQAIYGYTHSVADGSAGILGSNEPASSYPLSSFIASGVRGQTGSAGIGVFGLTKTGGSGVAGYRVSAGNALQAGSELGFTSTVGLQTFGTTAATGVKNFVEPHPTDPTKMIRYTSLEGNEAGTYFRGRARFQNGIARIAVPEDFRIVTDPDGLTVQITPIGAMATYAVMKMDLNEVVVQASRNVEFSYLVQGIRHAYRDLSVITENGKVFVPRSLDEPLPPYLPEVLQQRLISNGTYRPDGTVNMETARRLGWDQIWEERSRPAPEPAP
jgi:hypothetical protein